MKEGNQNMVFVKLEKGDNVPYELLLLADPSKVMVDKYLEQSDIYIAKRNDETLGAVVMHPLTDKAFEIKNIAVKPAFQGQGIGSYLIENLLRVAAAGKYHEVLIGTANSSIGQLYLYQKLGFEISDIKMGFFIDNYPETIFENGIQAKHLITLTRSLLK